MPTIETLDGPLDTAELGTVLMHEHVFNITAEIQIAHPGFNGWDPEVEIPKANEQLRRVKEAGIDTLVELSPIGLGRSLELIRPACEGTGLNVVLATGLYTYDVLPRPWHFSGPGTLLAGDEPLDELMRSDLRDGIEGSGVKPGILKCAIDAAGLTEHVERVVRSVCRIHKETGTPVCIHTHAESERGLDALRLLEEEGVDPRRVMLAHCGDSTDLEYLEKLAASGALLGMDRFGLDILLPFEERVGTVVAMCERGHGDKMILSQDANCFSDWFPPGLEAQVSPNWHFLHVLEDVVPALRERGVSDLDIDRMMRHNGRGFFERK
ncbi:MAG: phosphotriesterase-related protein [Actinomycetota bacterium]|nr:phosphotriesterase-related protein [Actinomycetota bacterium]